MGLLAGGLLPLAFVAGLIGAAAAAATRNLPPATRHPTPATRHPTPPHPSHPNHHPPHLKRQPLLLAIVVRVVVHHVCVAQLQVVKVGRGGVKQRACRDKRGEVCDRAYRGAPAMTPNNGALPTGAGRWAHPRATCPCASSQTRRAGCGRRSGPPAPGGAAPTAWGAPPPGTRGWRAAGAGQVWCGGVVVAAGSEESRAAKRQASGAQQLLPEQLKSRQLSPA